MGLKDLQNKQKIKYNISFISLSLFPRIQMVRNWVVRHTYILIVLFQTITRIIWKVAVNVICFTVSSSDDFEISLVAVNGFKQSVHHESCRMAICLWHPHTSVEHLFPYTESHQVTQVEQDRLQQ